MSLNYFKSVFLIKFFYIIGLAKKVFKTATFFYSSIAAISVFSEEHQNDPRCKSRGTKRKANDKDVSEEASESFSCEKLKPGMKYDVSDSVWLQFRFELILNLVIS